MNADEVGVVCAAGPDVEERIGKPERSPGAIRMHVKKLSVNVVRIFCLLVLLVAAPLEGKTAPVNSMTNYAWNNRVLVVFADEPSKQLDAQRSELAGQERELADRDMVVFAVIGDRQIVPLFGDAPPSDEASKIRQKFDVPLHAPFAVLLIGKDGGVKWRDQRPARPEELFALIDTMPMRKQEMR